MQNIIDYCNRKKPEEAGGVIRNGVFEPLENIAEDKINHFEFDLKEFNGVEAIVHSHSETPHLSPCDRVSQVATGLEWLVIYDNEVFRYRFAPFLRGRQFIYGKYDCGTLIEDAYMLMGINLKHFERTTLDEDEQDGVILKRLPKLGFYQVDELQAGDVIVTSSGEEGNHLSLFVDEDTVLTHNYNQLSRKTPYSSVFRKRTHSIWRHKDFKKEMIQAVSNDLRAYEYE